jgi:hypothetical protein
MQYKEEELAKYAEGLAEKINSPLLVKKYREMRIDPGSDASNL